MAAIIQPESLIRLWVPSRLASEMILMPARHGHFFGSGLLNSQFDALEPPQPGEPGVTVVPSGRDPAQTVAAIIAVVRGAGKGQSNEAEA